MNTVRLTAQPLKFAARLSTPFHKYDHVCGEGFLAQTRRERPVHRSSFATEGGRAYPSAVCKERATKSGPKRTAARRVASLFGSGFVAPRSQPHCGGCFLVAPRQNRKSTQQTWPYLCNGVLRLIRSSLPATKQAETASARHLDFGFLSSFVLRASSLPTASGPYAFFDLLGSSVR